MASAQVKNSFTSIGEIDGSVEPSTLFLKLAVSETTLRYFVLSNTHQRVMFYGQYALHHVSNVQELAQRITKICQKDEVLQLPFGQVTIGMDTDYSLLPFELLHLKNDNQHLQQCHNRLNIAYLKNEAVEEALAVHFPKASPAHLNSSFLNALPAYLNDSTDKVFINVAPGCFEFIRFKDDRTLLMMNRYRYKTETDFIYFVLLCCDELNINREQTQLVLMGEVSPQSKIHDVCYRYFKNIQFIEQPEGVSFSRDFKDYGKHLHFNLYTLTA
jgi:hypothetical protein